MTVLLIAAILAAGCGNKTGESLPRRELAADATAEKILVEAVKATDDTRTMHYMVEAVMEVPASQEQTKRVALDLWADADLIVASGDSRGSLEWGTVSIDFVSVGGTMFYRSTEDGDWFYLPAQSQLAAPDIASLTRNATAYLKNYKSIEQAGDEEVNGRPCYHLVLVPDITAMLAQPEFQELLNLGSGAADIETLQQQLQDAAMTVDYWVDKEYLVIRRNKLHWQLRLQSGEQLPFTEVISDFDMYFTLYNQELSIEPPEGAKPSDEVTTP